MALLNPSLYGAFIVKRFFQALLKLALACLSSLLFSSSPLFDPPEAWSNRAKRADALRPDAIGKSAALRAGQKRRLLAGAEPHGATRSPFFTGEHGEYGEHPPFDAPEHGARLVRGGT